MSPFASESSSEIVLNTAIFVWIACHDRHFWKMVQIRITFDSFPVRIEKFRLFLLILVSSIVPKLPKSDNINLKIYDETNAVIPFNLLQKVITTYMHRTTFRLRIAFGVAVVQSGVGSNIISVRLTDVHFIRVNK